MAETERRTWTWPWLIAVTLSRGALSALVGLLLWGAVPAVIGWHPTTVSSGSMLPRLHVGDVAVSRPMGPQLPPVGSVLLFDDPDHPDKLRFHRFVAFDDRGRLITRGDANADNDSTPVEPATVRGIGTLRVPWIGLPVVWLRTGAYLPLGLTTLALMGLAAVAVYGRRFTAGDPTGGPSGPASEPGRDDGEVASGSAAPVGVAVGARPEFAGRRDRGWRGRVRAPGAAGMGLGLALLMAVPAGAAFLSRTTSTASWAANDYFTCRNAIVATTPYLWYRMDETSNTTTSATDSSGNTRTGVYKNTGKTANQARACTPETGTAMLFDGATGYLTSPAVAGAAPNVFTLSIWFKTTSSAGGKLIGYGNSATATASTVYDRHLYLTNSGQLVFGVYPGAVRTVDSGSLTYRDGVWHQAVATLSTAGMALYVDGNLVDSDTTTTTGESQSGGYWRIAYDNLDSWANVPSSRFFGGTLDDAVVETSALTAAQVKAWYVAGHVVAPVSTAPTGGPALGNYQVMNYYNLVLDTLNGAAAAGSPLVSAAVTSSAGQVWKLQPMSDGSYKIVNTATGRIVGIENASKASGAAAVVVDDKTSADVLWKITTRGAGYLLVNVNSGLPLVTLNDTGTADSRLGQQTEAAQNSLVWRFNAR